jgi:glycosyltransferase involved in cell wall biosynthesis
MRILVANDGVSDVGGVQAYLDAVIVALEARGHAIAIAYCNDSGSDEAGGVSRRLLRFHLAGARFREALDALREWAPDVCYSHNMSDLAVDRHLQRVAPVVKFMHGYFGTCVSGQKMHAFPRPVVCDRVLGPACTVLYLPRRCGRFSAAVLLEQWRWALAQQSLFDTYAAIVVASEHMRREYVRNGCDAARVHVDPLFPTDELDVEVSPGPAEPHVVFLGRMTKLKGGELLIRSVRHAAARLDHPIQLTMAGDGPQRQEWQALASRLGVPCTFTGWVNATERRTVLRSASVVALPSLWPEPFGLVGLEAGAVGVPAIAVDAGGVRQWLRDGVNGVAVREPASERSFGDALASLLADRVTLAALRVGAYRVAQEMTLAAHVDRLEPILESADSAAPAS